MGRERLSQDRDALEPLVLLARPATQGGARELAPPQLPSQPLHRLRLQDAEPNPHSIFLHRTLALC